MRSRLSGPSWSEEANSYKSLIPTSGSRLREKVSFPKGLTQINPRLLGNEGGHFGGQLRKQETQGSQALPIRFRTWCDVAPILDIWRLRSSGFSNLAAACQTDDAPGAVAGEVEQDRPDAEGAEEESYTQQRLGRCKLRTEAR